MSASAARAEEAEAGHLVAAWTCGKHVDVELRKPASRSDEMQAMLFRGRGLSPRISFQGIAEYKDPEGGSGLCHSGRGLGSAGFAPDKAMCT